MSPDWQNEASCKGMDPETFYPSSGDSIFHIVAVCKTCVVREQCLDYALVNHERFGIWGGTSAKQRKRIYERERKRLNEQYALLGA